MDAWGGGRLSFSSRNCGASTAPGSLGGGWVCVCVMLCPELA